jgi:hypothetical protein
MAIFFRGMCKVLGVGVLCYKPEIAGSIPDEVIGFFN